MRRILCILLLLAATSASFVGQTPLNSRRGMKTGGTFLGDNARQMGFPKAEESMRIPLDDIEALTFRTSRTQAGSRPNGGDLIQWKVVSIQLGKSYSLVTDPETTLSGEGKQTTRMAVGGAGLGAIVGGIAGGGDGAGMGALAGVAGGTTIAATCQTHLKSPPRLVWSCN